MVMRTTRTRGTRGARALNVGYRMYTLVHKLKWPGVVRLTAKSYKAQPLRAWETALGLGVKRKGVIHLIRAKKRRTGGISGLF